MLDLHRLRLLRELDARGTVQAVSVALGYSTSAVSQQLAVLEREAGVALLERVGRNLRLTPAGETLVRHAHQLLADVEAAEAALAAAAGGPLTGRVRVAAFQSAFLRVVAPAVRSLAERHPGIRVEATEADVELSVPALQLQHLDLVIGDEYQDQPRSLPAGLIREPLLRDRINLVLPERHRQAVAADGSLAGLSDIAWAACQPGTGHHQMHQRVVRQFGGFEPDLRYTSDDLLILLELVRSVGAGALLPDLVLTHRVQGVAVLPLVDVSVGREVFTVRRRIDTPVLRAVREAVHEAAREALPHP